MGFLNRLKLRLQLKQAAHGLQSALAGDYPGIKVVARAWAVHRDAKYAGILVIPATEKAATELRETGLSIENGRAELSKAGYPEAAINQVKFPLISQEQLDREFGGSWRTAENQPGP